MEHDPLTRARTQVEMTVEVPRVNAWDLLSDISRMAEWSPECYYAGWIDGATGPVVGARFEGRNRFPDGRETTVTCVVTDADRPGRFAWVVLDGADDPERPGSTWEYDLLPGGTADQTLVRHTYTHGPGGSGFRDAIVNHPERTDDILAHRLGVLRGNMTTTLDAAARHLQGRSSDRPA